MKAQRVAGAFPDQRLMRPSNQLQRLDIWAVTCDQAVVVAVQTHDLSQHMRIPGI